MLRQRVKSLERLIAGVVFVANGVIPVAAALVLRNMGAKPIMGIVLTILTCFPAFALFIVQSGCLLKMARR